MRIVVNTILNSLIKEFIKLIANYSKGYKKLINSRLSASHRSTCPELLQLNTRRPHSGTPSRKSEKGLLLFFCPK